MTHHLTNRGKLILLQGGWADAAAGAFKFGLLEGASIPTGIDTEAEVQDLNTVGELLAITGVDEPVSAWYTAVGANGRVDLTRTAPTEDDTNNRVGLDADNVTYPNATVGDDIYGGFWYDGTTDTNDTTRLLCGVLTWTVVPTNGSDLVVAIADLVRGV